MFRTLRGSPDCTKCWFRQLWNTLNCRKSCIIWIYVELFCTICFLRPHSAGTNKSWRSTGERSQHMQKLWSSVVKAWVTWETRFYWTWNLKWNKPWNTSNQKSPRSWRITTNPWPPSWIRFQRSFKNPWHPRNPTDPYPQSVHVNKAKPIDDSSCGGKSRYCRLTINSPRWQSNWTKFIKKATWISACKVLQEKSI